MPAVGCDTYMRPSLPALTSPRQSLAGNAGDARSVYRFAVCSAHSAAGSAGSAALRAAFLGLGDDAAAFLGLSDDAAPFLCLAPSAASNPSIARASTSCETMPALAALAMSASAFFHILVLSACISGPTNRSSKLVMGSKAGMVDGITGSTRARTPLFVTRPGPPRVLEWAPLDRRVTPTCSS